MNNTENNTINNTENQMPENHLLIENVKIFWQGLHKRPTFNGNPQKFGATFLLSKDRKEDKEKLDALIAKMMLEKEVKAVAPDKIFLKDGDTTNSNYDDGCWYFKATSEKIIETINRRREPVTEQDNLFENGTFVNVIINPWVQKSEKWGNRVNCNLISVQFVKEREPFGGESQTDDNESKTFINFFPVVEDTEEVPF